MGGFTNTQRMSLATRACALIVAITMAFGMTFPPAAAYAANDLLTASSTVDSELDEQSAETYDHEFELTDSGIVIDGTTSATGDSKVIGDMYEVSKKLKLTITGSGTFRVSGERVDVEKGISIEASDVTLVLDDLTLSTTDEAPVSCKKNLDATIDVEGTTTLTDSETDESNSADPDGAAIKAKSGSTLTLTGDGTLNAIGNYKNGIKGATGATVIVGSSTSDSIVANVTAVNHGIASDGGVIINGGTVNIEADNDAVKSSPDADDTTSEGTIVVNGGSVNVKKADKGIIAEAGDDVTNEDGTVTSNTTAKSTITVNDGTIDITSSGDGVRADGDIVINNGTITVNSQADGIQSNSNLTIANGVFDVTTGGGATSSHYTGDASYKGLKANSSADDDNSNSEDTSEATNAIDISGGDFTLNTLDDAIHSDAYALITGGTFTIDTGDDGVHADTTLELGSEDGLDRDPDITINKSYEGLEAGTIYAYSGKYYVTASDDGINSAGGSSNGSDPMNPGGKGDPAQGGDRFNPGGNRPGGSMRTMSVASAGETLASADGYNMYIQGGSFYVDCEGDGLDSNGGLYLNGGNLSVFSQATGGDNSPLDSDGTLAINGATVFCAGTNPMNETPATSSQYYYTDKTSRSAQTVVDIAYGGKTVYSDKLVRNSNYLLYSSPDMTSSACTVSTASSVTESVSNAWAHAWDDGVVTKAATETSTGVMTYTCKTCGDQESKTIPAGTASTSSDDSTDETENSDGASDSGDSDDSDNSGGSDNTGEADGSDSADDSSDSDASESDENTDSESGGKSDSEATVFTATFSADEHASVNIYYTQDYTTADEQNATSAIARTKAGEVDASGDGQVNFAVVVADGYEIESVTAEPTSSYRHLKDSEETGVEGIYRITKISGDITVTVKTKASSSTADGEENASEPSDESGNESSDDPNTESDESTSDTDSSNADNTNNTNSADSDGDSKSDETSSDSASSSAEGASAAATPAASTSGKIDLANAAIAEIPNVTYTGKAISPKPSVSINGSILAEGVDYTLSYSNNKNCGTATVVIAANSDSASYMGSTSATFKIVKAKNAMSVSKTAKTVSASKVANSTKKVKALSVSNAKGSVKYTRVSGSKCLKVNAKNGKIVVAKGTSAGTYKIKVKVKAAGTDNYKSLSVTKVVKIVVK